MGINLSVVLMGCVCPCWVCNGCVREAGGLRISGCGVSVKEAFSGVRWGSGGSNAARTYVNVK